jgi:hypothetical protein
MKDLINMNVIDDVGYFFNKVNERALYKLGFVENYSDDNEPALGINVEYFHPQITLDDRMRYIMENIVVSNLSIDNIICNTIISHFYGARGIHQILTRDNNPKTALVDFERLNNDIEYENEIRINLNDAVSLGLPIYGSTELRTSLFGASNNYVSKLKNQTRNTDKINILLWVSSFIKNGITKKMANANSLKEMFDVLNNIEGVGGYYGYHCSTSNSVNPKININHDERFCVPGPGARKTLDMMFKEDCKIPYGDRVIWFRENYKQLIGEIYLHDSTHNVIVNGNKILQDEQDELKTYGCEVGLCQYGVYVRLKNNPHLINKRKVARVEDKTMQLFFNRIKTTLF